MEKTAKVWLVILGVVFALSVITNGVFVYRNSSVAQIIAQQFGYQTCVNEVNAQVKKAQEEAKTTPQPVATPQNDIKK